MYAKDQKVGRRADRVILQTTTSHSPVIDTATAIRTPRRTLPPNQRGQLASYVQPKRNFLCLQETPRHRCNRLFHASLRFEVKRKQQKTPAPARPTDPFHEPYLFVHMPSTRPDVHSGGGFACDLPLPSRSRSARPTSIPSAAPAPPLPQTTIHHVPPTTVTKLNAVRIPAPALSPPPIFRPSAT